MTVAEAPQDPKQTLLDLMSEGQTLTEAAKALTVSRAEVWRWRQADKDYDKSYEAARRAMADALADDALTRVKNATGGKDGDWQAAHAYSQRASWYASKMLPKLYGETPLAQINVDNRTVVITEEKRLELQDRLARLQLMDKDSHEAN